MSDNFRKWRSNSEVKPNLRDKTAIVQTGLRIFVIYRETLAHAFKKWRAELSQVTPQMRARQVVVRTGNRILIAYRQQLADAFNRWR